MTAQDLVEALRQHGIGPTPQRLAVYGYLLEHRTHPTADDVYQALSREYPTMSRTTVYNTLRALSGAGLLRVVTIDAEQQHFDAETKGHGHFRCSSCGTLFDFPLPPGLEKPLLAEQFETERMDVYATGICPACRHHSNKSNNREEEK